MSNEIKNRHTTSNKCRMTIFIYALGYEFSS